VLIQLASVTLNYTVSRLLSALFSLKFGVKNVGLRLAACGLLEGSALCGESRRSLTFFAAEHLGNFRPTL